MQEFGSTKNKAEIAIIRGMIGCAGLIEASSTLGGAVLGNLLEHPIAGGIIGALIPPVGLGLLLILGQRTEERDWPNN